MSQEKKDRIIQHLTSVKEKLESSNIALNRCEEGRRVMINRTRGSPSTTDSPSTTVSPSTVSPSTVSPSTTDSSTTNSETGASTLNANSSPTNSTERSESIEGSVEPEDYEPDCGIHTGYKDPCENTEGCGYVEEGNKMAEKDECLLKTHRSEEHTS